MSAKADPNLGPWNPGLTSTIPRHLMSRVTLYDPKNSFVGWEEAKELSEATGLKPQELALTRPERLALHSVLIRVTSQLHVPDGPNYADLGISLRDMAAEIYQGYVVPDMDSIWAAYDAVRQDAERVIETLLDEIYHPPPPDPQPRRGFLARLMGGQPKAEPVAPHDPSQEAQKRAFAWKDERNEDIPTASRRAIARTLGAILNKRGALFVDRDVIAKVSLSLVMNRMGSAAVGKAVTAPFARAVEAKGFRWLPPQREPLVLNAKGASASGKSTIRPAQREIAQRLGYDWQDFAIISPDYWRKALLDYDSLGEDFRYAAMLTGHELEVIDSKLDILMAVKGSEGSVPHMLIDRFRFDSFQPGRVRGEDSTLLTRFGAKVYLLFLVTPPAATIERAWARGGETGRFKAVDDLLFHNIEAYTGMPNLFFSWAGGRGKWVHYEFLDNSVPRGDRPYTIAYGQNGTLVVVDFEKFCDIDRFQHINVDATAPDQIEDRKLSDHNATAFLRKAMKEMKQVDVLVPGTNVVFARSVGGQVFVDRSRVPDTIDPTVLGEFHSADADLGDHDLAADLNTVGVMGTV